MQEPILIKFGDNDFHGVFIPLLRVLKASDFNGPKDQLLRIINGMSYSFYCLSAHRYYTPSQDFRRDEEIQDYLFLTPGQLYYGYEEVEAFFKNPEMMGVANSDSWYFYPDMDDVQSI